MGLTVIKLSRIITISLKKISHTKCMEKGYLIKVKYKSAIGKTKKPIKFHCEC